MLCDSMYSLIHTLSYKMVLGELLQHRNDFGCKFTFLLCTNKS